MTKHILAVDAPTWDRLRTHLFQDDVEQAAMIFAGAENGAGGVHFVAQEMELLQPADFDYQSAYHISLTDDARGRIIKRAWDLKLSIVEFHSHVGPFATAAFSSSDRAGLSEFVPHVRWRLRGAPYAAIVMTSEAFDGLVWSSDAVQGQGLEHIRVGDTTLVPTALSLRHWGYGR